MDATCLFLERRMRCWRIGGSARNDDVFLERRMRCWRIGGSNRNKAIEKLPYSR